MLKTLIVDEGGHIYVSGRAKNMPKSVEKAFIDVVIAHSNFSNQLDANESLE